MRLLLLTIRPIQPQVCEDTDLGLNRPDSFTGLAAIKK